MATDIDKTNSVGDEWGDLEFTGKIAEPAEDESGDGKVLSDSVLDELPDMDAVADKPVEQEAVEEQKQEEPAVAPRVVSKEEKAIISWKRKAKELEDRLRNYEDAEKKGELTKKYEAEGYDADTAKRLAHTEVEKEQASTALADMKFILENQAVMTRYPEAMSELPRVRKAMEATGRSAQEVCSFLFSTDTAFEAKARADATANARKTPASAGAAAITAKAETPQTSLSAAQQEAKVAFERMLGKTLSNNEVKEILSRANGRKGRSYSIEDNE